jgi:small subunit ribosomal protein S1
MESTSDTNTWPPYVTRRMQERPNDATGQHARHVGLRQDVPWKKRQVKGSAPAGTKVARQTDEETNEALLLASAVELGYDPEEQQRLVDLYDRTIQSIKEGEIVKGRILAVSKDEVIVDVGFKSEGVINRSEFTDDAQIQPGDPVEVFLEAMEDQNGQLVLSKQKADFMRVWDRIKEAHEERHLVRGRLVRRIKGGVVVDLFGAEAFLPGSQIALRQVSDFDNLLGTEMEFKIIKLNKNRRNIVVSRRVVLEEERNKLRDRLLEEIEVGQVREGIVKNVTDFGVFVDLGGVDGLLHITDMSWGRIVHPNEITKVGETIQVKVLDYNAETTRISLGLKQLEPYPWENIEARYPLGSRVSGKIVSVTDYGAFIELEKGIEGLIHVSEMSWTQHVKHPSKLVKPGDAVEAVVLNIDKENEKISLGIKQMEPDPWLTIEGKYPIGKVVAGKVRNLTAFGAFVELEEGIDGLVHISDMSWTKRVQHPSEIMKKGDKVDVKVLKIDHENRRISLGFKQLMDDPWPELAKRFSIGAECLGTVTKVLDRGVVVDLGEGLEGFVPVAQLAGRDLTDPTGVFTEGEQVPLTVIEFDKNQHKVILSAIVYYKKRERSEFEAYLAQHPTSASRAMAEAMPEELRSTAQPEPPSDPASEGGAPEA